MATTHLKLSNSTNGRPIKVVATATPGTNIHLATSTGLDKIFLWACNTDTVLRKLTLEWGGTTSPDDTMEIQVPPESGWIPVADGVGLTGGLQVKAFASVANVVIVSGRVEREA